MLDYIKSQLRERGMQAKEQQNPKSVYAIEEDPVVLVEYAHLFQELDELTVDGSENGEIRKVSSIIDIPIEEDDDLELTSVEMNLSDGRIMDVPMDATVTESMDYQLMKTFQDFYQEATTQITKLPRETTNSFHDRAMRRAEENYNKYKKDISKKELFGTNKISMGDASVPKSTMVNFGDISMKLPISYETDSKYNITRKQLDSLNYAKSHNVFQHLVEPLMERVKNKINVSENTSLWDIITPKSIMLSKGPADRYCFVLEYAYDNDNEYDYFGWSSSVSNHEENDNDLITESMVDEILGNFAHYETKDSYAEYVQEQDELNKSFVGRFGGDRQNIYQEAIDFGGGDVSSDAGSDLPPDPNEGNQDTNPTTDSDGNDSAPSLDMSGSGDTTGTDSSTENNTGKEEVDTNNVSDQIAEKVANQTQNQDNPIEDMDLDDVDLSGDNTSDSNDTDEVVNDKLADLDNDLSEETDDMTEIGDDTTPDDMGNLNADDIENMSIEEIVAQGSEKLKSMTISQLKDFLSGDSEV